jgi:antitoxin component YwqK of YwqJK toxin-antitoxin module
VKNVVVLGFLILIIGCDRLTQTTANSEFTETKNGVIYFESQPFTGRVITLTVDFDTIELYEVREGMQQGHYQSWYKDKSVNESKYFKENRRHGFHQKWYPDGQNAFEYHFDNGVYVDTLKEWYPNGQLYLLSHYSKGQQSGRQKAWRQNGELYLNYDVVNGRKYGNSGIKHCKSLWSEVVDSK